MSQIYIIARGVSSYSHSPSVSELLDKITNDLRVKVFSMFRRLNCFAVGMDGIHVLVDPSPIYEITRAGLKSFVLVSVLFLKSEEDQNWDILSIADHRELAVAIKAWFKAMSSGSFSVKKFTGVLIRFEQTDHVSELLAGHTLSNPATWFSVV